MVSEESKSVLHTLIRRILFRTPSQVHWEYELSERFFLPHCRFYAVWAALATAFIVTVARWPSTWPHPSYPISLRWNTLNHTLKICSHRIDTITSIAPTHPGIGMQGHFRSSTNANWSWLDELASFKLTMMWMSFSSRIRLAETGSVYSYNSVYKPVLQTTLNHSSTSFWQRQCTAKHLIFIKLRQYVT